MYPVELKYTPDHEWLKPAGATARVGITDFAQKQLGDVVFLELPQVGRALQKGETFGTVESVKAVSELFSPVAGEVVAINTALAEHPEGINADPHGSWMVEIKVGDAADLDALLDAAAYEALTK